MNHADTSAPCTIARCQRSADWGRWCCEQCAERMRAQLREIEDYAATLDPAPGKGGDSSGRHSPGFGSRSPARDDVISALDYRTVTHDHRGPDDEADSVPSILGTLHYLARWIAEEADDLRPSHAPTIAREAAYLRARIDWTTGQQWVDELADELRRLHGHCRRLAGDPPPKPVAPCPDCDGPLWPRGDNETVAVRCGDCGRSYDGLNLLGIAARQEHAA